MSLGSKLQKLRKSKNLSQEAFADIMKVSRQSVSKWELDQTFPEISKLIEIADYFQITLDDLLRDNQAEALNVNKSQEEEYIGYQESVRAADKNLLQYIRSLPMRIKLTLFIVVTVLFLYVSYRVGDYTALIAYLCSALAAAIVRRWKAERYLRE